MKTLHLRFGGYQKPASIHNQAATFFGQRLSHRLKSELEIQRMLQKTLEEELIVL